MLTEKCHPARVILDMRSINQVRVFEVFERVVMRHLSKIFGGQFTKLIGIQLSLLILEGNNMFATGMHAMQQSSGPEVIRQKE